MSTFRGARCRSKQGGLLPSLSPFLHPYLCNYRGRMARSPFTAPVHRAHSCRARCGSKQGGSPSDPLLYLLTDHHSNACAKPCRCPSSKRRWKRLRMALIPFSSCLPTTCCEIII